MMKLINYCKGSNKTSKRGCLHCGHCKTTGDYTREEDHCKYIRGFNLIFWCHKIIHGRESRDSLHGRHCKTTGMIILELILKVWVGSFSLVSPGPPVGIKDLMWSSKIHSKGIQYMLFLFAPSISVIDVPWVSTQDKISKDVSCSVVSYISFLDQQFVDQYSLCCNF